MKKMRRSLMLVFLSVLLVSNNLTAQDADCLKDQELCAHKLTNDPLRILPVPASLIVIILEKLLSNHTIVNLLLGLSEKALEKLIEDLINHAQSHVDCPPTATAEQAPASFFQSLHNQVVQK